VVMTQLRSQMKVILWILVFAFLATIVFSWGMGGFKSRDKPGIIGVIDGYEVTYEEFDNRIRLAYDNVMRQSEGEPDENKIKRLREETWNNDIDEILRANEAKRLGIKVTDEEVAYVVQNYPPQEIQQVETFQKNGKFDLQLYQDFLREPQALRYLLDIERRVKTFLIDQELNFLVAQCTDVPIGEVRDEYLRQTATAKLKFLVLLRENFEIDSAEITDRMMRHYYQLFSGKFKQYPKRQFAYVKFITIPTSEDTLDIIHEAKGLMEEIRNGADFAELALQSSEDKSTKSKGGDLGWINYESMVEPFSKAAFAAEPGEPVGPVQTRHGFHVILVEDKRTENGVEEVKARHILLKIKPSPDTRDQVYTDAYNFSQDIKEADFAQMAEDYGYDVDTTDAFSEAGYIKGLGKMRMAAEFCFNNPVGAVSDVYPVPEGYIVFQICNVIEESIKPFDEVKSQIYKKISKVLLDNKVWDKAAEVRAGIETVDDMEGVAKEYGLKIHVTADSIRVDSGLPDNLRRDKDFLTQAFRLSEGDISDIISTGRGCYIAYMESKSPWNDEDFLTLHPTIYNSLVAKKQQQTLKNWQRELRIAADIRDYRYKYFHDF